MAQPMLNSAESKTPRKYDSFLTPSPKPPPELIAVPVRLQARLSAGQVAKFLNFTDNDIRVLIQVGLLKPLGNPPKGLNVTKYFATVVIEQLAANPSWLDAASKATRGYWKGKNDRKTANQPSDAEPETAVVE